MFFPLPTKAQQINTDGLREITSAVQDMCLHPDRTGRYFSVEGEAEGSFLIKLIGAELEGLIRVEQWEGIHETLESVLPGQPLNCTMHVLPILLEAFRVPDSQSREVQACIKERVSNVISQPFSIPASVRCPGGGCFLKSSSCNDRGTSLRYAAPSGYFIEQYRFVQGANNYGNTGRLKVHTGASGKTNSVSVHLSCSPPDHAGAPGGWNNGELRGTISYIDLDELRSRISTECALRIGG